MKRIIIVILIISSLLLITICSSLLLICRSDTLHQYILTRVNMAIPGNFTLGSLDISLFDIKIDLHDVTLADSSGVKLAALERLYVSISTPALLRKRVVVKKAMLENPRALLSIDSSGILSLLRAFPGALDKNRSQPVKKNRKLPVLEVRNLSITYGSASFSMEHERISVQACGLSVYAEGSTSPIKALVTLSLDSVNFRHGLSTLPLHDLSLMTQMNNLDIDTVHLEVKTDKSALFLDGGRISSLTDTPRIASCAIAVDASLSEVKSFTGLKEQLDGVAHLRLKLSGTFSNPDADLAVIYDGGTIMGYPLESLNFKTSLRDLTASALKIQIVSGLLGSADVTGSVCLAKMFPAGFTSKPQSVDNISYHLAAAVKNISLDKLTPAISGTAALRVKLDGRGIHPGPLDANAIINADAADFGVNKSLHPSDASVACTASLSGNIAHIRSFKGTFGSACVSSDGTCDISSGEINANLNLLVPSLDTLLGVVGINIISGSSSLAVHAEGNLKHPRAVVKLKADTISVRDIRAETAALDARLDSSGIVSVDRLFLSSRNSSLELSGMVKLLDGFRPVSARNMEFDGLLHSAGFDLRDVTSSASGMIHIDAQVKGTARDLDGKVRISADTLSIAGQRISSVKLDSRLDGNRIYLQPLSVLIDSGQRITATGWASMNDSFSVKVNVPQTHLNTFRAITVADSFDGILSADIDAGGTYKNPSANGNLLLVKIHKGSASFDDISLAITLSDNLFEVTGTAGGELYALYNILDHSFSADLRCNNMLLTPYLALSGRKLSGILTADLSVSGTTDSLSAITGKFYISHLALDYDTFRIVETSGLNALIEGNRYNVPQFHMALANEGVLDVQAAGNFAGPHDINVAGMLPLSIIPNFSPDLPAMDGQIILKASLKGNAGISGLAAQIKLEDAGMILPGTNMQLHAVNGNVLINNRSVRISPLAGKIDEGFFSLNGELKLDSLRPADVRADLELKSLPVPVPDMLDVILDGKLRITGNPDTTMVSGDISIVDGLYYKDLVINPLSGSGERKRKSIQARDTAAVPYLSNMHFDIDIKSRTPFLVDNNLMQLTISPDLQLMGTLKQPTMSGRAIVDEGTITYLYRTFTIDRGMVDFINPYAIEPVIDIEGTIPVRKRTITIVISGTPEDLSFSLSCDDPTLEDQDILSLLVIGKTTTELQNDFQSDSTFQSSQQMIASLVASTVGGELRKTSGLDILDIETGDESADSTSKFAVTVGKKVTKRLSTSYRVESVNNEIVQRASVEYRLLQNLVVTGYQYLQGIYGGELRFTWERR